MFTERIALFLDRQTLLDLTTELETDYRYAQIQLSSDFFIIKRHHKIHFNLLFVYFFRIDNNNVSVFGPASIAQRLIFAAAAAAAAAPKVIKLR